MIDAGSHKIKPHYAFVCIAVMKNKRHPIKKRITQDEKSLYRSLDEQFFAKERELIYEDLQYGILLYRAFTSPRFERCESKMWEFYYESGVKMDKKENFHRILKIGKIAGKFQECGISAKDIHLISDPRIMRAIDDKWLQDPSLEKWKQYARELKKIAVELNHAWKDHHLEILKACLDLVAKAAGSIQPSFINMTQEYEKRLNKALNSYHLVARNEGIMIFVPSIFDQVD